MGDVSQSMRNPASELVYIHDPMCSWCWGFDKTRLTLFEQLKDHLHIRRLLGGLAPDSDQSMPADMQRYLQATWHKIEQRIPGTQFNFNFWNACQPRRSTWPACRAVIAARAQGLEYDPLMTHAIQEAYYLHARNPSDDSVLVDLANVMGLDSWHFERTLISERTQQQLLSEIQEARALGVEGFPSLVLSQGQARWRIPIDYTDSKPMLEMIQQLLNDE